MMDMEKRSAMLAKLEQISEIPLLILSLVFLVIVILPDAFQLSPAMEDLLNGALWLVWGVFLVDLSVKTYLAPKRIAYLRSHWIDVLTVVVPFLRPLRLLRVAAAVARTWQQTRSVLRQRTLSFIGVASLLTVVLSASLVYAVERGSDGPIQTFIDALWWSVTTITTVGYGDMYPVTNTGRGTAVFLMLTGITFFGLITASVAAFFVEDTTQAVEDTRSDALLERVAQIERSSRRLRVHWRPSLHRGRQVRRRKPPVTARASST